MHLLIQYKSCLVRYINAIIRAFAQLFFSTRLLIGLLSIVFIGILSYQALLLALLAANIAHITSTILYPEARVHRLYGQHAYNATIVGVYLTPWVIEQPIIGIMALILLSALTVFIHHKLNHMLNRLAQLPILSLSMVIAIIFANLFSTRFSGMPLGNTLAMIFNANYLMIFYIGYMVCYSAVNYRLGLVVVLITLPVICYSLISQQNMSYLIINLAITIFAVIKLSPSVANFKITYIVALISIICCIGLYFLGKNFYSYTSIPVLSLPSILATWIGLFVFRGVNVKKRKNIFRLLKKAKFSGKRVICITGAGISTPSGIPDYASGQWADPSVPTCYYTYPYYLAYRTARKLYIDACAAFLGYAEKAKVSSAHKSLHILQTAGFISSIITQNVDGLLQKAGCCDVLELHGNIHKLHCLQCARESPWIKAQEHHDKDLLCVFCCGLLKPAVIAYGEPLNQSVYQDAITTVESAAIVLVIGTRLLSSSAADLVSIARKNKAIIIFINDSIEINGAKKSDIFIAGKLEIILPKLLPGMNQCLRQN